MEADELKDVPKKKTSSLATFFAVLLFSGLITLSISSNLGAKIFCKVGIYKCFTTPRSDLDTWELGACSNEKAMAKKYCPDKYGCDLWQKEIEKCMSETKEKINKTPTNQ